MGRLIDADAFLKEADKALFIGFHAEERKQNFIDMICAMLDNCTTVDAVEVVRCRDCKHWDSETWFCDNHSTFWHHGLDWNMFSEDDFCSYGERKDCGSDG